MTLTREEFARGMAPVLAVWPKEAPPAATLEVYYLMLAHIPAALFNGAVVRVLSAKTFGFPKPHDFIEAAVVEIMVEHDYVSEAWARQELDEYRERHLAFLVGAPLQIGGEP